MALGLLMSPSVGAKIDAIACSASCSACGKHSRWADALKLLGVIAFDQARPDAVTFGTIIDVARWSSALALLMAILCRALEAGVVTRSAAVNACEKSSQWRTSLCLVAGASGLGPVANIIACNALAGVLAGGSGRRAATLELLAWMSDAKVVADTTTFHDALDAGPGQLASEWLDTMSDHNLQWLADGRRRLQRSSGQRSIR